MGLVVLDKKIFESCILKTLIILKIRTIFIILEDDYLGTIPVEFGPQRHNLNNFGRGPLDDAIYQI